MGSTKTKTTVAARKIGQAPTVTPAMVKTIEDAESLVVGAATSLDAARLVRVQALFRFADDMGGWSTRGVQTAMADVLHPVLRVSRTGLVKYMKEGATVERVARVALRGLTFPTGVDVSSWGVTFDADRKHVARAGLAEGSPIEGTYTAPKGEPDAARLARALNVMHDLYAGAATKERARKRTAAAAAGGEGGEGGTPDADVTANVPEGDVLTGSTLVRALERAAHVAEVLSKGGTALTEEESDAAADLVARIVAATA